MQIVIEINDNKYNSIMTKYDTFPLEMKKWGLEAIHDGTPLSDILSDMEWDIKKERDSVLNSYKSYTPNEVLDIIDSISNIIDDYMEVKADDE